ncbi:DUF1801 domain-containing protein [Pontibacter sp. SGAir0037]|uniref:DUF1801 domain-containing protein n=1 Tax=Pontibacter sp. SGAir0037 TaxID=2571030 RepID=UPI0010CCE173|nr:DUF1801 domain-containing protein [Pontibacter sp. SGAir0037]QCR23144.1 hypothetical protein C1N53_12835 [Pontibacter sp. SGAir0037]
MRSKTTVNQVDEYLEKLTPEKLLLAQELRRIITSTAAHLEECVRWDSPCYFFYGPVCYFASSRSGLHFGFFRGKELDDPEKRLVSRNGQMLHVKVRSMDDINEAYFVELIKQAVHLNQN